MLHRLAFTAAMLVPLLLASGGALAADLIGVVTDRSGRPQPGTAVELLDAAGEPLRPPRQVDSNAQGQFLIPNIEAGTYRLRCGSTVQATAISISVGVVRFDCKA